MLRKPDPSLVEQDQADVWVDEAIQRVQRAFEAGASVGYVLRIFSDTRRVPLLDHPQFDEFQRDLND